MEDDVRFGTNELDLFSYPSTSSFSEMDSLLDNSTGLGWSDLFYPSIAFPMPTFHNHIYHDPLGLLAPVANQPQGASEGSQLFDHSFKPINNFPDQQDMGTIAAVLSPQPPPYAPKELDDAEILENAKVLLKHFRECDSPVRPASDALKVAMGGFEWEQCREYACRHDLPA
jgi:arginine metabolism regulation protein II